MAKHNVTPGTILSTQRFQATISPGTPGNVIPHLGLATSSVKVNYNDIVTISGGSSYRVDSWMGQQFRLTPIPTKE